MFSLYVGLILSLLKKNINYMLIVVIGAIVSISYIGGGGIGNTKNIKLNDMVLNGFLERMPNEEKNEIIDVITDKVCTKPTQDNPYMNWLNGDDT